MKDKNNDKPPFKVGEKVLRKFTQMESFVQGVLQQPCGCWSIDVGLKGDYLEYLMCQEHNTITRVNSDILFICPTALKSIPNKKGTWVIIEAIEGSYILSPKDLKELKSVYDKASERNPLKKYLHKLFKKEKTQNPIIRTRSL